MLCPNCKQQLMNVNGRYICVDCGTEVPENEIPVAQTEYDTTNAKVEGNDYFYSELKPTSAEVPSESLAQQALETPQPKASAPAIETPQVLPASEAVPEAPLADLPLSQLASIPPIEEAVQEFSSNPEPVVTEAASPEVTEVQEVQPESLPDIPENSNEDNTPTVVVEPNIGFNEVPQEQTVEEVVTPAAETQAVPEVEQALDLGSVTPVEQPAAQEAAADAVAATPITEQFVETQAEPEPVPEAVQAEVQQEMPEEISISTPTPETPVNFVPMSDIQKPAMNDIKATFDAQPVSLQDAVISAEATSLPELQAQPQAISEAIPQDPLQTEYNFSENETAAQDKTVYQNPIYDLQDVQAAPDDEAAQFAAAQVIKKRRMIIFSVIGGIGVLILLIGGFFLYSVLTRPAVVNTGNFESITDCGSSGPGVDGSEKAKACFDESFKTCSLSTYKSTVDLGTQGGIVTNAYEITGKTDNSCTVESKFTQNPNAAWVNKKMVCEMDNTKTFDQALNGNSSSNCSGPLADLMYGSDTNEDENANTEN